MLALLYFIAGAAIALFSYHAGRNNAVSLPKLPNPFARPSSASNGEEERPAPVHPRGM